MSCAPSAVPAAAVRSRPLTAFAAVTAAMLVVTVLAWPASAGVTTESARSSNRGAIAAPWQVVLDDVAASAQRTPYHAELLVIVYDDGREHLQRYEVRADGSGTVTLRSPERYTLRLAEAGGSVAHHAGGWFAPLPGSGLSDPGRDLAALSRKYRIDTVGGDRVLDRPATLLEIRRRSDGRLRERVWVDAVTGLIVRRESYDGESRPLGIAAFLSLDTTPARAEPRRLLGGDRHASRSDGDVARAPLTSRAHDGQALPLPRLDALAEAGWTVPVSLPAGYEVTGSYALDAPGSQPLHLVYSDGLYTVSLFEQRGHPDWDSLPEGAQPSPLLDGRGYEWSGAMPRRLVWEADGTTYSLVGDAPPDEFAAIAKALPQPQPPSLGRRLSQGLRRLLSLLSPWS